MNLTASHTPGPWTFVQGGTGDFPTWNVRLGDRGTIRLPASASMEVMDADARLIAAAPKLLEALNDLLDDLEFDMKTSPASAYRMVISGQRIEQARAAIAKATGGGQ